MPKNNVLWVLVMALLGMICVFFGVGFLLTEHWHVETTRSLQGTPAAFAGKLGDFSTWASWADFKADLGPQTERVVEGTPGQVGHRVRWQGPAGQASLELAVVEANRIEYVFRTRPTGESADLTAGRGSVRWQAGATTTEVTWRDEGTWPNLAGRWVGWFGGLQERVRQIQTSSLEGLQRAVQPEPQLPVVTPPAAGTVPPSK